MRVIKLDFIDLSSLGAIALTFAMVWGGMLISGSKAYAQEQAPPQQQQQPDQAQPPQQDQAQSTTFTGTIVKSGTQYVLHEVSGQTYKLDDAEHAKAFAGKTVKVTGTLDEQAKLIHVESIQSAEG